ncbi:cytochrome P450 [Frankia sp. CNm7]|uniref:Cytochrome P450 n=1 Tax=Frankia nepalensis TaxID=1836974 RepID=A0A937RLL6_9ACTN|nr:cytochrome P450 [Frankia nepalensis]MBL7497623.1 cytochrome P450 [Frankia nepalensis]MBL7510063.1 cytochrome P450 [Frankia nepalensis]MBL7519063.1 cytochrome P450 [Frankia nepalensis]MBL7631084.1 cytochrome P450 [Frankia nepalensis]
MDDLMTEGARPAGARPAPAHGQIDVLDRYPAHAGAARLYGDSISGDVDALYRRLRAEHGPVAPVLLEGDIPAWLVLGYREAYYVASRADLYIRDSAVWNAWDLVPADWPLRPALGNGGDSVTWVTGAEHARHSDAIHEVLAAVDPFELRARCERIADELIDTFADRGRAELMYSFAHVMPARAIAGVLGIPAEDTAGMVQDLVALFDHSTDALAAHGRLMALVTRLITQRRDNPGVDAISRMVTHPAAFTDVEALQDIFAILASGQQPVAYWIGNTLRLLLADPRFATTLAGGRRSVGQAMTEVLWEDPPVANFTGRWAVRAGQLGGQRIQAGDMLVVGVAAANADPEVRPDPAAGPGGNQAYLTFGTGEHRCPFPAQELAEVVAQTAVEVLLDRLPDLTLAVPADDLLWNPAIWVRGLTTLPVTFTSA